jgi:maltooligosyltrehalose trehalohydrolase
MIPSRIMNIGATYLGNGHTEFTVWAPLKEKMVLHIVHPFDKETEMQKDALGYFHVVEKVGAGCKYFFKVDGKDLADPASQLQPEGVHGPSEVIDHTIYSWKDEKWKGLSFSDLILYELHVGTFTGEGTFEAIIPKLDHLVDTGINAIELMPAAQFPGERNWGYDGVFPYAVQNSYGGPQGLKKLVDACHQKGIALFLDVVYNHLGPEGNYFESFAPYFTDKYKTPWGKAVNFDDAWSDGVKKFFSDNAIYWLKHFHIDGLRFDAVHYVIDLGAVHFWESIHEKICALENETGKKFHTIAESDLNSPKVTRPQKNGGWGFTAQWLDDFHHALYVLLHDKGKKFYADFGRMEQLVKSYKDGFVHDGGYVTFRKRKHGASSAGVSGDKFIVFTDNHDQAGNRATGARLTALVDHERIKLAAAACLLSPYIPMLFMGEEYGEDAPFLYFVSHSDQDLIRKVQEGRKNDFSHFDWSEEPPDPQDEKTFLRSKLQWNKLDQKINQNLLQWYKMLIQLRKNHPALKNFNKADVSAIAHGDILVLERQSASRQHRFIALFNFSETETQTFNLPANANWKKQIDSTVMQTLPATVPGSQSVHLPPLTVTAYETNSS